MLVVLVLLLGFDTFSTIKNERANRDRARENHALGERNRQLTERTLVLAERNCRNGAKLTAIERAFVARTEGQTEALLKSGITFGIPADQLPALIAASKASQARFLGDLDKLAAESCTASAIGAPIVKPKKAKGGAKPKRQARAPGIVQPGATAAQGRVAPSKPVSPRARANPLPRQSQAVTRTTATVTQTVTRTSSPPPASTTVPPPILPPPGEREHGRGPPIEPPGHVITIPAPCVETPAIKVC